MQPTIFDEPQKIKQSDAVVMVIRPYEEASPLSLQANKELVNNDNSYPIGNIVKKYLFFGGAINSALMMPLLTIQTKGFDLKSMLVGFIFILLSTALTGFLIANFKLNFNAKGLLWSAVIGAGITFKTFSTMEFTTLTLIILTAIGVVSAVLVGLIALPNISNRDRDII